MGNLGEGSRSYHMELRSWKLGRKFVGRVYELTETFPTEEKFGLTAQLRRASVSVASNIAEGAGRKTLSDYLRFLYMARGSVKEIETQLILANDVGLITKTEWQTTNTALQGLGKALQKHINSLERKPR